MNDDGKRLPQRDLANVYQRGQAPGRDPPRFVFDRCQCAHCHSQRVFDGGRPLVMDIRGKGFGDPLKIILNELPASAGGQGWSHAGVINERMSNVANSQKAPGESRAPVHVWQSSCPGCRLVPVMAEVERLAGVLSDLEQKGRVRGGQPTACRECGERRSSLAFDVVAGFQGGASMGTVTLVEADLRGWDFRHGPPDDPMRWIKLAEHWAFHGVLDRRSGDMSRTLVWTATCPKCVKAQLAVVGQQPIAPSGAPRSVH